MNHRLQYKVWKYKAFEETQEIIFILMTLVKAQGLLYNFLAIYYTWGNVCGLKLPRIYKCFVIPYLPKGTLSLPFPSMLEAPIKVLHCRFSPKVAAGFSFASNAFQQPSLLISCLVSSKISKTETSISVSSQAVRLEQNKHRSHK